MIVAAPSLRSQIGKSECLGVLEGLSYSILVTCIEGKEGKLTVTIPVSLHEIVTLAVSNQP